MLDKKYNELNNLLWVELKEARNIIKRHNSSLNINLMINEYTVKFIENIKENKNIWYGLNELRYIYKNYKKTQMKKKEIAKKIIFPKILKGDKKLIYDIKNEILNYIKKNNYYDWFLESIKSFEIYINNKKTNKLQNKKYIPPHMRNKN